MAWIWYACAGVCGFGGLILLGWSLVGDRARGRSRCPRCWYQMAPRVETLPITCSECGRSITKMNHLQRTRRRWRWASLAVLVILIAASLGATPAVRRSGWAPYAPTTLLILLYAQADSPTDKIIEELDSRFTINENWGVVETLNLRPWQETLLAKQCASVLHDEASTTDMRRHTLDLLVALDGRAVPAISELVAAIEARTRDEMYPSLKAIRNIAPQGRQAIPALISVITLPGAQDEYYTDTAVEALGGYVPAPPEAVVPLIDLLQRKMGEYSSESLRDTIVETLGRIGPEAAEALPYLFERISGASPMIRAVCIESIGAIDALHPEGRRHILDGILDPEVHIRSVSAEITRRHAELLVPSLEKLMSDLQSESGPARLAAARSLATLGAEAAPAIALLEAACRDENRSVRLFALEALARIAEGGSGRSDLLESLTRDDDPVVARAARRRVPG